METYDDMTMLSPTVLPLSDDELFALSDDRHLHETVETVPLRRIISSESIQDDHDTIATLPISRPYATSQNTNNRKLNQPLTTIDLSSDVSSPPSRPLVQVAASSPLATPRMSNKPSSILANAMAPAGTFFRRPTAPSAAPRPLPTLNNESQGPVYRGGSSDSDEEDLRRNDIKPTTFMRRPHPQAEKIPESPRAQAIGNNRFKEITASAFYSGSTGGSGSSSFKRSGDVMAAAYGGAAKRVRQTIPSRAEPVKRNSELEIDIDDITDYNTRQKVRRLRSTLPLLTVRECVNALQLSKGVYEDAVNALLEMNEEREQPEKKGAIEVLGSDDELMPTPAAPKRVSIPQVKQQVKAPSRTIAEKWSSTQNIQKPVQKPIEVFDEPPKKGRSLVRGRRARSPPSPEVKHRVEVQQPVDVDISDDSGQDGPNQHSGPHSGGFAGRLLEFFNVCSSADLSDTATISKDVAEYFISKRPFKSLAAVAKVEAADAKPATGKRKVTPLGEKVLEKVDDMLVSYEAVDYLVRRCEDLAKPLAAEMKTWGVKTYGSEDGELDMTSLQDALNRSHDSGIGTPVSDDDSEIRKAGPKKFIPQPSSMASDIIMKDYQIVGVNWMNLLYKQKLSGILGDDMGLGKTCQIIAFLAHLKETGENGPHLVVVPAATLENWLKEFQRFCPGLHVEPYYATNPAERFIMREEIEAARDQVNVVVTTYTIAKGKEDFPWLKSFGFCCTVYDEGHVLKNASSQVSRKLIRIESKFRLLLTGTPLQNNLKELISLLAFLMPAMFQEKKDELQNIFAQSVKALDANHEALLSAQRIARARTMLTPFILRRKKHQVLRELPKKERRTEFCPMTPEQTEIYHMWLQRAYDIRERRSRGENVDNESTNILMKLRQAAIHPMLFRRLYPDEKLPLIARQCLKDEMWRDSNPHLIVTELDAYSDMEIHSLCDNHTVLRRFALNNNQWLASGKVKKMLELLRMFMADGHRTLIFSQFVMVMDILELVFEREGISYFRLDGSTKVSERQDLIDEFCADDNDTPVFMLSTKAGGAGINLAKANKVIVFDSGFNPQDDIQAENRAHRIGQTKEVEVVRLVSKGTVEEQIYAMGLTKLKLDEQVTGDGSEEQIKTEDEETELEKEGRISVEDMFFQKLGTQPPEEIEAETEDHTADGAATEVSQSDPQTTESEDQQVVDVVSNYDPIATKVGAEDEVDRSQPLENTNLLGRPSRKNRSTRRK